MREMDARDYRDTYSNLWAKAPRWRSKCPRIVYCYSDTMPKI